MFPRRLCRRGAQALVAAQTEAAHLEIERLLEKLLAARSEDDAQPTRDYVVPPYMHGVGPGRGF